MKKFNNKATNKTVTFQKSYANTTTKAAILAAGAVVTGNILAAAVTATVKTIKESIDSKKSKED